MINIRGQAIFNTHPNVRDFRRKTQTQDEHGLVVNLDEKDITTIAKDKDGNVIVLDESKISTEMARLQAEYDSLEYARNRKTEYDALNQFEMQFDDDENGTTTWKDAVNAIKAKYPKPE